MHETTEFNNDHSDSWPVRVMTMPGVEVTLVDEVLTDEEEGLFQKKLEAIHDAERRAAIEDKNIFIR